MDYFVVRRETMNLSSFVQSRNTQNDERKRFLEPEVATLPRTVSRQPPLQRLGLGRLSGKCYNELPTDGIGVSVSDSHRRRWSCYSIFPAFCQDWREQECQPRMRTNRFPDSLSGLPIAHAAWLRYILLRVSGGQPPGLAV